MINQRIAIRMADPMRSIDWKTAPDPPLTAPSGSNFSKAKKYIEAWIGENPRASLGSALCLGICIGWLIKRR
jgi:hypothetical protein